MGLENPLHIALLLMVLLLVFGAKRLPEMGRGLGDGLRSFKDAVSGSAPATGITASTETPHDAIIIPTVVAEPTPVTVPAERQTVA
jgi:sec-independent protein translocase protein TatA